MKLIARLAIMSATPLLTAALWMDRQPSPKPYQAPVLAPPTDSVPVTGKRLLAQEADSRNQPAPTPDSLERGAAHYRINCAMCHGASTAELGPVGKKLKPPPPVLDHDLLQARDDTHIFNAISLGFGRMPPFKAKLSHLERWELVNFLRTRK